MTASARWRAGRRVSRATHGEFTQKNDDTQAPAQKKKKKTTTTTEESAYWLTDEFRASRRLQSGDPNARGEYGNYAAKISPDATAKYLPKLQRHLKELGGDALADKVKDWGVFKDEKVAQGQRPRTNYVDLVANKCYRSKPEVVRALTAEASA